MAATVSRQKTIKDWPHLIREVQMSALVGDQSEDVAHGGPTGLKANDITFETVTPPTAPCTYSLQRSRDDDSTSNDTSRIKFAVEGGGDLTGAVVKVRFHFYASASGGISAA